MQVQMGSTKLVLVLGDSRVRLIWDGALMETHGIGKGTREEVVVTFGNLGNYGCERSFFLLRERQDVRDVSAVWGKKNLERSSCPPRN